MRTAGISGNLFPAAYLADRLLEDARAVGVPALDPRAARRVEAWWRAVSRTCGAASGLRSLFDVVAMPLLGMLGFEARQVRFEESRCVALLVTPAGAPVALMIQPWAERPGSLWREVADISRTLGSRWCYVLAPPFFSLVEARGCAVRRSLDFEFPAAIEPGNFDRFMALGHAQAFDRHRDHESRLDHFVARAAEYQDGVRADLQHGVMRALDAFAGALLAARHPRQADASRGRRPSGGPSTRDQALTLVYRVLFLLFAESRGLRPRDNPRFTRTYAIGTLCRDALTEQPRFGVWASLAAITRLSRSGSADDVMRASAFNGRLFARGAAPALERRRSVQPSGRRDSGVERATCDALASLGSRQGLRGRELIHFRDLGVEQLGAVYERVLDREPAGSGRVHSDVRKQTGTFYTPQPLADFVVRRTLGPLVAGASADGILQLRVVDPAMGSGAFLVAACRFLARAYGHALVDEGRASPSDLDRHERARIRRLIAERCLAGVDSNPVAVQLARLSLWLTSLSQGRPLSFLDHRLRVGNSLIGTTPDDLWRASQGKRAAPRAALPLLQLSEIETAVRQAARPLRALLDLASDTVADVRAKETLWRRVASDRSPLAPWRRASTLWCARWFWPPAAGIPPTPAEVRALVDAVTRGDQTLSPTAVAARLEAAERSAASEGFFHWPLEFADVFYDADGQPDTGGFHAVIGNPPWEMLRREAHRETAHDSDCDGLPTPDNRTRLVRFIRESGLFPSCDRGHVNLYQPFVDRALSLARPGGRIGLIVPWGLAVDDGAEPLRRRLLRETSVDVVVGLDNASGLFPIHRGLRFAVVVTQTGGPTERLRGRFGVRESAELDSLPGHDEPDVSLPFPVRVPARELACVGGTTLRIPDLRRPHELTMLRRLMASLPRLGDRQGWHLRFGRELNATEARGRFGASGLPIIEGKHLQSFAVTGTSGTCIPRSAALSLLPDGRFDHPRLGYRDVSGVANTRSLIAAIVPAGTVTTHTVFCLRSPIALEQQHFLCGLFNSFVLNAIVRLLMGGHVTTTLVEDLPAPPWRGSDQDRIIALLSEELSRRPDDPETQATLDAHVAHLFGFSPEDYAPVVESFPLVPAAARQRTRDAHRRISRAAQ